MKVLFPWLLLAGCHQVFGVDAPPDGAAGDALTSDGANGCPVLPALPPGDDEDLDQHLNGQDNCPHEPNVDQHDENSNGIGDACDLCPAASVTRDADCDGIGDACDPDDTRPDTRLFYGLADLTGLTPYTENGAGVSSADDRILLAAALTEGYAGFRANGGGITNGRYEARFTITDGTNASYQLSLSVSGLGASGGSGYSIGLVGGKGLIVEREPENATDVLLGIATLPATPDGTYMLIVEIEYPILSAQLIGPASTELLVPLDEEVFAPTRFGVRAYECDASVDYMAYTGAVP